MIKDKWLISTHEAWLTLLDDKIGNISIFVRQGGSNDNPYVNIQIIGSKNLESLISSKFDGLNLWKKILDDVRPEIDVIIDKYIKMIAFS